MHIPYCRRACYYCNFHFNTRLQEATSLIPALLKEMRLQRDYLGGEGIESLYIGGGTPSILPATALDSILQTLHACYHTSTLREVTMEVNPEDVHTTYLKDLKSMGVNRLSIGAQSFYPPHLRLMNRSHTPEMCVRAIACAKSLCFSSVSIDLIYGIPHHDHSPWQQDIQTACMLAPDHLSTYVLTVEAGTVLHKQVRQKTFTPATQDFVAAQYDMLITTSRAENYEHYEVANFSRGAHRALHNANYWQGRKYLGIGPAAHSYNLTSRQHNVRNNAAYLRALQDDKIPCEIETLSTTQRCNEYILTRLRTKEGVDIRHLQTAFHYDIMHAKRTTLRTLIASGLLIKTQHALFIPEEKWMLADEITLQCMV